MASILSAGTTTSTSLNFSADTSGVLQLASNNGTTAVTVDTNQGVGLNGSVSSEWASSGILQVNNSAAYSTLSLATTRSVSSGNRIGSIVFEMPNNTATYRSRAEIECDMIGSTANKFGAQFRFNTALDNAAGLTTGLVVNPYGIGIGGSATPSSGTGIAFPATQNPSSDANTLDDYEEGTWTPTSYGTSNVSSLAFTLNQYTKIGRLVNIQAKWTVTAGTGNCYAVVSVPFVMNDNTNVTVNGTVCNYPRGANYGLDGGIILDNTSSENYSIFVGWYNNTAQSSDGLYINLTYYTTT